MLAHVIQGTRLYREWPSQRGPARFRCPYPYWVLSIMCPKSLRSQKGKNEDVIICPPPSNFLVSLHLSLSFLLSPPPRLLHFFLRLCGSSLYLSSRSFYLCFQVSQTGMLTVNFTRWNWEKVFLFQETKNSSCCFFFFFIFIFCFKFKISLLDIKSEY